MGCPANTSPDIANGMLVYNNGTGTFSVGSNGDVTLQGTPLSKDDGLGNTVASRFAGMLFFESRSAPALRQGRGAERHRQLHQGQRRGDDQGDPSRSERDHAALERRQRAALHGRR